MLGGDTDVGAWLPVKSVSAVRCSETAGDDVPAALCGWLRGYFLDELLGISRLECNSVVLRNKAK